MESHRHWWSTNRFRHQPLETICCTHSPEWSCTTYFVFCLEFLYQVGASSANSNPGTGEHKGHFLEINIPKTRSWQTWYQSQANHWLIHKIQDKSSYWHKNDNTSSILIKQFCLLKITWPKEVSLQNHIVRLCFIFVTQICSHLIHPRCQAKQLFRA